MMMHPRGSMCRYFRFIIGELVVICTTLYVETKTRNIGLYICIVLAVCEMYYCNHGNVIKSIIKHDMDSSYIMCLF